MKIRTIQNHPKAQTSDRARRAFLKQAAGAAASLYTATTLAAEGNATTQSGSAATPSCRDVKLPMKDVENKVAFITGGSSGIGLGIARAFAEAGMKIALGYRGKAHLDEAMLQLKAAGDRIHPIAVDVTDRAGMEQAAAETVKVFGKVHVIVNNAGVQHRSGLADMSYEDWDRLMRANLDGVFNGVRAFLPHIKAHGDGGQIVTTASILGLITAGRYYGAYCASKFAAVSMMESLRVELADSHIGVSAFCPGMVQSDLEKGLKDVPGAADPLEIGRLVLRGVRNNDLYILTHPEMGPLVQQRFEVLKASSPTDVQVNPERQKLARPALDHSIYAKELNRQRCAKSARSTRA